VVVNEPILFIFYTYIVLNCASIPGPGIHILFSKRPPHSKLSEPEDAGKLLVVSYAWDGNALPGNEFWMGKLSSTGDSAAACSTQVRKPQLKHHLM
jgi:hypothetical protein